MQAKLCIHGVLEVEGSEALVKEIYEDFKNKVPNETASKSATESTANQNKPKPSKTPPKNTNKKNNVTKTTENFNYVDELWQGSKAVDFKKSYTDYEDPKSHPKYVTLFLFILKNELKMENITLDHLYTCYRLAGIKLPKHLRVAVNDAKKKAWVIDNWEDLRLAPMGEDAVIHDFAKKAA